MGSNTGFNMGSKEESRERKSHGKTDANTKLQYSNIRK